LRSRNVTVLYSPHYAAGTSRNTGTRWSSMPSTHASADCSERALMMLASGHISCQRTMSPSLSPGVQSSPPCNHNNRN
jgi:hypothetical protein